MAKKLRVLYVVVDTMDIGGIAPTAEHHVAGLKEAGYDAEFMFIRQTKSFVNSPDSVQHAKTWAIGEGTGQPFSPVLGWRGQNYCLYGKDNIAEVVKIMNTFDVVIWGAAFGFNVNWYRGRDDWMDVFKKVKAKKIVVLHDLYLWKLHDWYAELDQYVDGWACVHKSNFDQAAGLTKPRALISFSMDVTKVPKKFISYGRRQREVFSVQNAKVCKRVDRLVRAVPYTETRIILGGDGLVLRNMRAPIDGGKMKGPYIVSPKYDPDAVKRNMGKRFWDVAVNHPSFLWLGMIGEAQRDMIYRDALYALDLSDAETNGQVNRVSIEAMAQGCVPIAVPHFITGVNGTGDLKPGVNYIPINSDTKPKWLAEQIDDIVNSTTPRKYAEIQEANRDILRDFDRKRDARSMVNLALGKIGTKGRADAEKIRAGRRKFNELFREKQE